MDTLLTEAICAPLADLSAIEQQEVYDLQRKGVTYWSLTYRGSLVFADSGIQTAVGALLAAGYEKRRRKIDGDPAGYFWVKEKK